MHGVLSPMPRLQLSMIKNIGIKGTYGTYEIYFTKSPQHGQLCDHDSHTLFLMITHLKEIIITAVMLFAYFPFFDPVFAMNPSSTHYSTAT